MRLLCLAGTVLAFLLTAVFLIDWNFADNSQTGAAPPEPPVVPKAATPRLVMAAPLPAADGLAAAKPVIAADHQQMVVVAQSVSSQSQLTQWRFENEPGQWSASEPLKNWPADAQFVGDPWLTTDRRGRFYLVQTCLEGGVLAFRQSADAARTWSPPLEITRGSDRPVLGISPRGEQLVIATGLGELRNNKPTPPLNGNDPDLKAKVEAAVRWSSGTFVSSNRGRNWKRRPGPFAEAHAIPFSATIDDDGHIASSWIVANGKAIAGVPANSRSVVCSTVDQGQSWVQTDLVADLQPDRNHPFNGQRFPVLALGSTGIVHVAFVESRASGLSVRHNEPGKDWTPPVHLSSDSAEEVRMPAIDARGTMVHVTWMEKRDGRWQAYYRGSRDHGQTWSDRVLLSLPHGDSPLIDSHGFMLTSDDDQSSVADDGAGKIHAVWAVQGNPPATPGRVWQAVIEWRTNPVDE